MDTATNLIPDIFGLLQNTKKKYTVYDWRAKHWEVMMYWTIMDNIYCLKFSFQQAHKEEIMCESESNAIQASSMVTVL